MQEAVVGRFFDQSRDECWTDPFLATAICANLDGGGWPAALKLCKSSARQALTDPISLPVENRFDT